MAQVIKILLVEDIATDAELIKYEIGKSGIEFISVLVETEDEFIASLNTFCPDIILSDYLMPVFDGMKALKIQQELAPNIPFILVTGSINEETAVECIIAGADDYVIKKNLKRLGLAIKGAIGRKKLLAEKREIEAVLSNSEERYKSLFESAAIPIFEEDFSKVKLLFDEIKSTGVDDFRTYFDKHPELIVKCASLIKITDVNSESLRFFQATDKNEIYNDMSSYFLDESWGNFKQEIIALAEGKTYFECEIKVATFSWEHRDLILKLSVRPDSVDTLKQVLVSFVDITARKQAEASLAESEELFRTASENAIIGVCMIDDEGNFIFANNAICTIWGYTQEELLKSSIQDIIYPEDKEKGLSFFSQLIAGEIQHYNYEQRYYHKNGSIVWASVSTGFIQSEVRRKNYFVFYIQDITERRIAEELVRKSEEKFRLLFENAADPIQLLTESLQFIDCNEATLKILGATSKEQILVSSPADISPEFQPDGQSSEVKSIALVRDAFLLGNYQFEWVHRRFNGGLFNVDINLTKVTMEGNAVLLVHWRDITVRKSIEEALIKSEEKFRLLAENASDVIWTMDIHGNNTYMSPSVKRVRGYSPEEALLQSPEESLTPESVVLAKKRLQSAINQIDKGQRFENYSQELEQYCKNNTTIWVEVTVSGIFDSSGKFVSFLGVSRDITDRKKAETALVESQEKYRMLIENQGEGVGIVDINEVFLFVNPAAEQMFEVSPGNLVNRNLKEFLIPEQVSIILAETEERLKGVKSTYEVGIITEKGNQRHILITSTPYYNSEGIITGTFGVFRDVTDRKVAEEALIAAKNKAEENDRLKTAFLNNISHEIRTPMNAIIGFTGFLNEPNLSEDKRKYFTDIICNASTQLLSIITDIINISTIEAGQETVNKNKFKLNQKLKDLHQQFEIKTQNLPIELKCFSPLPDEESEIETDEIKLVQILTNLIGNALKFTKQGYVEYGYTLQDQFIEFFVKDTGIGIDESLHAEIFDRFRQADSTIARKYGGTGLGLSISKAYIELLGGKIWLNSQPGRGSEFYFTIPSSIIRNGYHHKTTIIEENTIKSCPINTLLVAEDEEFNFKLLEEILSGIKPNIIRVTNGAEAVMACKSNFNIDIVIMDVKMPVMDGYEATKLIKKARPDLPVIIQTAYARESDREKAFESGCDAYFPKPLVIADFLALLEKLFSTKKNN